MYNNYKLTKIPVPRPCGLCENALALMECTECFSSSGMSSISFCSHCFKTYHQHINRVYHLSLATPINYPENMSPEPYFQPVEMNLQAIICLVNTNHFISFVKCGPEKLSPWIQQDSMYDGTTAKVMPKARL